MLFSWSEHVSGMMAPLYGVKVKNVCSFTSSPPPPPPLCVFTLLYVATDTLCVCVCTEHLLEATHSTLSGKWLPRLHGIHASHYPLSRLLVVMIVGASLSPSQARYANLQLDWLTVIMGESFQKFVYIGELFSDFLKCSHSEVLLFPQGSTDFYKNNFFL
jgi:hypothetical protein